MSDQRDQRDTRDTRDRSERFESWAKGIAALLVPIVVLIGTGLIENRLGENQTSATYVELAVQILSREKPGEDASIEDISADEALREYAVSLLVDRSPVEVSKKVEDALLKVPHPFGHDDARASTPGEGRPAWYDMEPVFDSATGKWEFQPTQ